MVVRVIIKKVGGGSLRQDIERFIIPVAERHTFRLAEETVRVIRENIQAGITRPGSTGNLARAFFKEKTSQGYGVGRIEYLNSFASHWRHINYGSLAIGANYQHRVPTGSFQPGGVAPNSSQFGQGRWVPGTGNYSFIPTKPIEARNYIEKTLTEMFAKAKVIIQ